MVKTASSVILLTTTLQAETRCPVAHSSESIQGPFATTPEELGKQGFDFSTLTSLKKFVLGFVGGQDTGLA